MKLLNEGGRETDPSGQLCIGVLLISVHVPAHVNGYVRSGTKKFLENALYNLFNFQEKKLVNGAV